MRTVRIYELVITYPEGVDKDAGEWEEYGTPPDDRERFVRTFPFERRFLSSTGAKDRALRLAALGCTVTVRRSAPIQLEPEAYARFEAQPQTDPYPEFEPAPAWSDVPF